MRSAEIPSPVLRPIPLSVHRCSGPASPRPGPGAARRCGPPARPHGGRRAASPAQGPPRPGTSPARHSLLPHRSGSPSAAHRIISRTSLLSSAATADPPRELNPGSKAGGSTAPSPRTNSGSGSTEARPGRDVPEGSRVPPEEDAQSSHGLPPAHVRCDRPHTGRTGDCGPGPASRTHQEHREPPFGALPGARRAHQQQHRQHLQQDSSGPPPPAGTRRRRHPAVRRPPRWPRLFRSPRRDAAVGGPAKASLGGAALGSARAVTAPGCHSPARSRLGPAAFPEWRGGSPPLVSVGVARGRSAMEAGTPGGVR